MLGGGLVGGSAILLGGDPGIGKSTILLQAADALSRDRAVIYASGEESVRQVALRARRLGLASTTLRLLAETRVEAILDAAGADAARVIIVDSIQTVQTDASETSMGSASQVRESAGRLVRHAKENGAAVFLIGHVMSDRYRAAGMLRIEFGCDRPGTVAVDVRDRYPRALLGEHARGGST